MRIIGIDHLVLTVRNVTETCAFYSRVLGMRDIEFAGGRKALLFGRQKINLHEVGKEYKPHAQNPLPGTTDICFITGDDINDVVEHIKLCGVVIEEGPVTRDGAAGTMQSIYIRDPDGNLVEVSSYR